jgi:feruloyl-CoA synthase
MSAPFAPTRFAAPDITRVVRPDGSILLESALPLGEYDRQVGNWLRRWAVAAPDRLFLVQRGPDGDWKRVSYRQASQECDAISQSLLNRGLSAERPVMILSEKSIAHALLSIGAMQVGIPVVPVSPAYSLRPEAQARLVSCLSQTTPGLILVEDGLKFDNALSLVPENIEIVHVNCAPSRHESTAFSALLAVRPTDAVEKAFAAVDPDAPAKILFTSGSTGQPKPAINTHRMMCSNVVAEAQLFPFLTDRPPVVVDWQPWHHCGGGSFNFHSAFANGGTYVFDLGKPLPDQFGPTLANLREISPTIHFNVPQGYDLLCYHLERDEQLRDTFFRDLDCLVYSGALMPASLWRKLEDLAVAARGVRIPMVSAYGMTETGPLHTIVHWPADRAGLIGCPIPGATVKLVPNQGKFELRAKGPNIAPGYFRAPQLSQNAFDSEGYFLTGDAVRAVDEEDPNKGLAFDGRLVEEFKLVSGTWVPSGALRSEIVSECAPYVQDALVVGEGRAEIGLLLIPNLLACRDAFGLPEITLSELIALPSFTTAVRKGLARYNERNSTSSRRIGRALPIDDVPSLAAGETTDKGYINQKFAIQRRSALVDALFDEDKGFRMD